jgi:hypothetical protein
VQGECRVIKLLKYEDGYMLSFKNKEGQEALVFINALIPDEKDSVIRKAVLGACEECIENKEEVLPLDTEIRICATCRYETKLIGKDPCLSCGDVSAHDRWEKRDGSIRATVRDIAHGTRIQTTDHFDTFLEAMRIQGVLTFQPGSWTDWFVYSGFQYHKSWLEIV